MKLKAVFSILLTSCFCAAQPAAKPSAPITDPQKVIATSRPELATYTLEQFSMIHTIGDSSWSPDGKSVALISDLGGVANLWVAAADGGWPRQLVFSKQKQAKPAWSPDAKWIAYQTDTNGDGKWDIAMVSPETGEIVELTHSKEISEGAPEWSSNARLVAYPVAPTNGDATEISSIDVLSRKVKAITTGTGKGLRNLYPLWSADGKSLVYSQENTESHDSNIFLLDLASGKSTLLTPHQGDGYFRATSWSPDGRQLLITSSADGEFRNVALLSLATKKLSWLTKEKWDVESGQFSPNGKQVTWMRNREGNRDIFVDDLATKQSTQLKLGDGQNRLAGSATAFSRDGSKLLVSHDAADAPKDLWSVNLATRQARQITHSLPAGIRPADMVKPYLVHYPSGNSQISAWVYMPYNITKDNRFPAVVYLHDGEHGQAVNRFDPSVQYLNNQGYVVIAPNYRGSSGFGAKFAEISKTDSAALDQIVAGVEFAKKLGYVDPKKLIVMGKGAGANLAVAAMARNPEIWGAGVVTSPTAFDFNTSLKTPVLVLSDGTGAPKSNLQQLVDSVKKSGAAAQLKTYDAESDWTKSVDELKRVSDFVKVQVPSPGCGCTLE